MLSQPLESVISNLGASAITDLIMLALVLVFVIGMVCGIIGTLEGFTQYTPALLTSLGIFGTFCGIVAGLLGFDVNDIDNSIELLLGGMKTAFMTSLMGMFLSMLFKLLISFGWISRSSKSTGPIGIAELYNSMEGQREGIEALYDSIASKSESSLTSQIILMRSDNSDSNAELAEHHSRVTRHNDLQTAWQQQADKRSESLLHSQFDEWDKQAQRYAQSQEQFQTFRTDITNQLTYLAETISKSATEQVIEALKQVITDFNNNLTEQFGENFKHLNNAVLELVKWQDNYKEQLGEMRTQFTHTVTSMDATATSISEISEQTKSIPTSMKDLQTVLQTNQHQINELSRHLDAFKEAHDKAVTAVPKINSLITETLDSVNNGTEKLVSGMTASNEQIGSAALAFNTGMQNTRDQIEKTLQDTTKRQAEEANNIFNGLRKSIEGSLTDTQEAVEKQVNLIDKSMEHEVAKVMTEMGRALTTITGKFTEDYQQLVRAMDTVVRHR